MPTYAYCCARCGEFSRLRSLAEFAAPAECPECGAVAPRALAVPHFAGMEPQRRLAESVNERNANAPKRHSAGCGCCAPAAKAKSGDGVRGFAERRPWMISH